MQVKSISYVNNRHFLLSFVEFIIALHRSFDFFLYIIELEHSGT
jgi:hypothetical protein